MIKRFLILISLIFFSSNFLSKETMGDNFMQPLKSFEVFIRIFKHEKKLEIWTKNDSDFVLYKKYNICYMSGDFGPKRCEGDYQVPEGFYHITDFNFYSKYRLGLGINYPNESDKILSNCKKIGGSIYIHGDCVSVGCVSMGKEIDEIFDITIRAKLSGQKKIPVHIFPINYYDLNSLKFFEKKIKEKKYLSDFELNIFEGFIFFEENLRLPEISVDEFGKYIFK